MSTDRHYETSPPPADCFAALLGRAADRLLRLEAVARPRDRLDVLGRPPVVAQLDPELQDVAVDDVALDLEFASPNCGEKVFPTERFAGVGGKKVQKRLLDRRELKL